MRGINTEERVHKKEAYEWLDSKMEVRVRGYISINVIFEDTPFKQAAVENEQNLPTGELVLAKKKGLLSRQLEKSTLMTELSSSPPITYVLRPSVWCYGHFHWKNSLRESMLWNLTSTRKRGRRSSVGSPKPFNPTIYNNRDVQSMALQKLWRLKLGGFQSGIHAAGLAFTLVNPSFMTDPWHCYWTSTPETCNRSTMWSLETTSL